jgi:RimJ/RimL family protein N-acetyltransferase
MAAPIEIETARLRLRQWCDADREPFATMNTDGRVMEFYPVPLSRQASDAMVDRCRKLIDERGWGLWAVEVKADHTFIGYVGLHIPVPALPCSPCVEVGWRLAFEHWGHGYAGEAAAVALQFGFEQLALPEIVSFTTLRNRRSMAVMERLGMLRDPDTFDHPSIPAGSGLREHCLYRLSCERWSSLPRVSTHPSALIPSPQPSPASGAG